MIGRRAFVGLATTAAAGAALLPGCRLGRTSPGSPGVLVNDVHSRLNATRVLRVETPTGPEALAAAVRSASASGRAVSIAGGRHAMGGQQFGTDTVLLDTRRMSRVLELDRQRGEIEVEAGIEWPELHAFLLRSESDPAGGWTFVQKQTGADRLTIAGSLAANVHGRGLTFPPFVRDVPAIPIVGPDGRLRRCSRSENAELFRAAIGGYGLFGPMASVRLRLTRRRTVERTVELVDVTSLPALFDQRIREGFLYGDFQFATDLESEELLRQGVFSCYRPIDAVAPSPSDRRELSAEAWTELLYLAHVDRGRAFRLYSSHYLTTSGQVYWSDEHQMSTYVDDYHQLLGARLGPYRSGGEMITEVYVPRTALVSFLDEVRSDFREHRTDLIYGTVRLVERDTETMLAWATQPYACIIFNLHVTPTPAGLERARVEFRRLIDRALPHGGSFYLTYHRWADRRQVLAAYPQFPTFLRAKLAFDPEERFQSDWYRHLKALIV